MSERRRLAKVTVIDASTLTGFSRPSTFGIGAIVGGTVLEVVEVEG